MCDTVCANNNKHRFGGEALGVFRLYSYICNICGTVFSSVEDADDHVKENHFFPALDF
ncbi:hypothetical protein GGH94_000704 [Coemansia aciculifera]|uniref:C2H2-type domain-containing protein n=2 Tax=Coemansia TaxID=4863 RepID=A0A9W8LCE9_9FUNG|nr:hypothetical protein GGI19_000175 [Coemansia pectinata]KAJ2867626.1 hypothetical protein GGH94_000704 [Coemansia aciculifera]